MLIVSQHGDDKGGAPDDNCRLEKYIKAMIFLPEPRTQSSSFIDMSSFFGMRLALAFRIWILLTSKKITFCISDSYR